MPENQQVKKSMHSSKIKYFLLPIIFMFSILTHAQIDSILTVLEETEESGNALFELQLLSSADLWSEDRFLSDSILEEAYSKMNLEQNPLLFLRAKRMIAKRKFNRREYSGLHEEWQEIDSLSIAYDLPSSFRMKNLMQTAKVYKRLQEHESAIHTYLKLIDLAKKEQAESYIITGYIENAKEYVEVEDYYKTIESYLKALEYEGEHVNKVYRNLPNVYRKVENWDKVIEYGKYGLDHFEKNKNWRNKIFSLMQVGYAYMKKEDYETALPYLNEAWRKSIDKQIITRAGNILSSLITVKIGLGDIEGAIAYKDSINVFERSTLKKPAIYSSIGKAYLLNNNLAKALEYAKIAEDYMQYMKKASTYDKAIFLMESYGLQSTVYSKRGDYKNAYKYQTLFNENKSIVENKKSFVSISNALNQQELAKQKEVFDLEQEKQQIIHKSKIKRWNMMGLLGMIILGLSIFTVFQLRKRNNKIEHQNKIITTALAEKDILLREIHHRVKNNLQLVSSLLTLQGRSIDDQIAQKAIEDGKNRVRSMALIHQDLYNKEVLTDISVKNYIEKLISELYHTYKVDEDKISLIQDIDDIDIDVDTMVPLGLIINELITNSLKYAFPNKEPGELKISLKRKDDNILLCVEDNGIGYDIENVRTGSFGNTLINSLSSQISGKKVVTTDNGTSITITFPEKQ